MNQQLPVIGISFQVNTLRGSDNLRYDNKTFVSRFMQSISTTLALLHATNKIILLNGNSKKC